MLVFLIKFQKFLEEIFYKYGVFLAKYPIPFLIIPLVISGGLGVGMMRMERLNDAERLYTPTNGPSKSERITVRQTFPENDSYLFQPTRRTTLDGGFDIIISDKNYGNIYTKLGIEVALALDTMMKNIVIEDGGNQYSYYTLCAAWKTACLESTILKLFNMSADNFGTENITYPFYENNGNKYFTGNVFGAATLDNSTVVITAEALFLTYYVRYQDETDIKHADVFLRKAIEELKLYTNDSANVHFRSTLSLDDEIVRSADEIVIYFAITYFILTVFAALTCNTLDPVRSKIWVAFGGEVAAALAILSSLGLMSAAGVPFATTVSTVPFLIMGIGIDDMFVIVSSWQLTSYTLSVEERMGKTMENAAISITVTSITDALAFGIGAISSFEAVTLFCAYAGVAVLFSYIYAITFCSACLAISGKFEHQNRHATLCCITAVPRNDRELEQHSCCFRSCLAGGDEIHLKSRNSTQCLTANTASNANNIRQSAIEENDASEVTMTMNENSTTNAEESTSENTMDKDKCCSLPSPTQLIRDQISDIVVHKYTKLIVMILYFIYISISIWGCVSLREGIRVKNLAPDDSYVVDFFKDYDKYFYINYGPKVMVVFHDNLDYSNVTVQSRINDQLKLFQNNNRFKSDDTFTDSWLNAFNVYLTQTGQTVSDMTTFINILENQFFTIESHTFELDVDINDAKSGITASRFLVQGEGIVTSLDERALMLEARRIASESSFNITVFAAGFIFFDQYVVIVDNTLQNLGIAIGCMLVVSFILLPSIVAVVFVTLSVISICIGVIGFMVHWSVNLDSISMINLIMCIGFSVDFSAHISYHFAVSNAGDGNDKAKKALGSMGWPIIQGAISTILGVIVLGFSNTYIFRTFFKIMFLVMSIGFFHAFFILPTCLSFIYNIPKMCKRSQSIAPVKIKESRDPNE